MTAACPDAPGFVRKIQTILRQPFSFCEKSSYFDISRPGEAKGIIPSGADEDLPPSLPLLTALSYILGSMREGPFDLTRLGINELFKAYLRQVDTSNQETCTNSYLDCVYQIYLYSLAPGYPFAEMLWEYVSLCFDTTSKYLVEHKLDLACQVFLHKVSLMGKTAAQKGLHTSTIQNLLHHLEIRAAEKGLDEVADSAKNHRFNLETY